MAMASLWANTAVARSPSASAWPISRLPSSNTGRLAGGSAQASSPSSAAASAKASLRSLNGWMSGGPGSWTTRRWPRSARCTGRQPGPAEVVVGHRRDPGAGQAAHRQHHRHPRGPPEHPVQVPRAHGQQHQPVHLAGQEVADRPLQHLGVVQ